MPTFLPDLKAAMSNWNCGRRFSTFLRFLRSSFVSTFVNPSDAPPAPFPTSPPFIVLPT